MCNLGSFGTSEDGKIGCVDSDGRSPPPAPQSISSHAPSIAALRLLVLALEVHPEDMADLAAYGNIPEHLAQFIDDLEISDED